MRTIFLALLVLTESLVLGATAAPKKNLRDLRIRAAEVLKMSTTSAREHVQDVFDLADALRAARQPREAAEFYEAGLRIQAWAMDYHATYAEVLKEAGQEQKAIDRAEIVLRHAERDAQRLRALAVLGLSEEAQMDLPPIARLDGAGPAVVLVPVGKVDVLLLRALREPMERELGIPVHIQQASIEMPGPTRRPLDGLVQSIQEALRDPKIEARVRQAVLELGLTMAALDKADGAIRVYRQILFKISGEGTVAQFDREYRSLAAEPPQWLAGVLIEALQSAVKPHERQNVRYIGVTQRDIYDKDTSFLFGLSSGYHAVLSYWRFTADYTQEPPSWTRLVDRTLKQGLSSATHAFGLPRCSDPTCARAYPHDLREHDTKGATLCPACKRALRSALGLPM